MLPDRGATFFYHCTKATGAGRGFLLSRYQADNKAVPLQALRAAGQNSKPGTGCTFPSFFHPQLPASLQAPPRIQERPCLSKRCGQPGSTASLGPAVLSPPFLGLPVLGAKLGISGGSPAVASWLAPNEFPGSIS
jgi:hypothetical protein